MFSMWQWKYIYCLNINLLIRIVFVYFVRHIIGAETRETYEQGLNHY